MAAHSSAIPVTSSCVPAALVRMEDALPEISSRVEERAMVSPERDCTLSSELCVRPRTSPTTPLSRSELSCSIFMAPLIGPITDFRMLRKAAATRTIPSVSVTTLVIREET